MMGEGDLIKLFIGQVPYSWTEVELHELFEKYGEIKTLKVLTDRDTGRPKGCAFLIFKENESARRAQDELHEKRKLPGARSALQVKPAASEKEEFRKLYVGNLSRRFDENDVINMFASFGNVESVNILKNPDGKSRGCGFVKFENQQQAQAAIRALHNSETLKGCTYPIIVKIADTEKDKLKRKRSDQPYHNDHLQRNDMNNQHKAADLSQQQVGLGLNQLGLPAAVGTAGIGNGSVLSTMQPQLQQQILSQVGLPQILPSNSTVIGAGASALGSTYGSQLVLQQQQLQAQQLQPFQQLQSLNQFQPQFTPIDPQTGLALSQGALSSALILPPGLGVGQGLSTVIGANQLSGVLQNQLGTVPGMFPSAPIVVQNPYAYSQQSQFAGALQQQLNPPLQNQLAVLGQLPQNTLGTSVQNLLSSSMQNSLVSTTQLSTAPLAGAGSLQGYNLSSLGGSNITLAADNSSLGYAENTLQQTYIQSASSTIINSQPQIAHQPQGNVQKEGQGPEGANLFIYQVPPEFTDSDLASHFAPFGNIISAKIFIDKKTSLSKGFGFVSYESPSSANAAISAMNGVTIGSRRLRVQLKKPKERGKPY